MSETRTRTVNEIMRDLRQATDTQTKEDLEDELIGKIRALLQLGENATVKLEGNKVKLVWGD